MSYSQHATTAPDNAFHKLQCILLPSCQWWLAAVGLLDARLTRSALLTGSIGNILHLDLLIVFGQSELQQSPAGQSVIEIEERLLYKECTETVWIKGYHTIFL